MRKTIFSTITTMAALSVSGLGVALSVASAVQQATIDHDRVLRAGLTVVIILPVHLLPTLLRQPWSAGALAEARN